MYVCMKNYARSETEKVLISAKILFDWQLLWTLLVIRTISLYTDWNATLQDWKTCIFHLPYSVTNVFLAHRWSRQPIYGGSDSLFSDLNYSASQGVLVSWVWNNGRMAVLQFRARFPVGSLGIFKTYFFCPLSIAQGSTQPLTEMDIKEFPGVKYDRRIELTAVPSQLWRMSE